MLAACEIFQLPTGIFPPHDVSDGHAPALLPMKADDRLRRFEQIVLPHLDRAYGFAVRLTGEPDAAHDAVQEAYLLALRHFDQLKGGNSAASLAWLLSIVRNAAFKQLRQRKRVTMLSIDDDLLAVEHSSGGFDRQQDRPDAICIDNDREQRVQLALRDLPFAYREVLILREFEELSYAQITEVLQVPAGTVMSRLARARMRLKAILERSYGVTHEV
jgi:RNA polymerase sigma-70 factor, ECF subfamily